MSSVNLNNSNFNFVSNPIKKQKSDVQAGYEKVTASLWGEKSSNIGASYFYGAFIPNFGRESKM